MAHSTARVDTSDDAAGPADTEPKRFGVRDLRNDTATVIAEAERSGAVYITRNGDVVAKLVPHRVEPDRRTPTRRLLDSIAVLPPLDDGWSDDFAEAKRAEIEAQREHDRWG